MREHKTVSKCAGQHEKENDTQGFKSSRSENQAINFLKEFLFPIAAKLV